MNKHVIIALALSLISSMLIAQANPTYTAITGSLQAAGPASSNVAVGKTINFTNTYKPVATLLREKNKSARLFFKLDFGNDYVKQSTNWNFKVQLSFDYQFGSSSLVSKTMTISTDGPELIKIDDVLPSFVSGSPAFTSTITAVTIDDGNTTPAALTGLVADFVNKNLRFSITLAREFDVDVRLASNSLMSNAPTINTVSILNRLATFSWQPNSATPYPNYEIQILKLENSTSTFSNNLNQMATISDWSKALKVETQSHLSTIKLTIAEGTGYYLWRVRPIGTYFAGGIGNSENYGDWSYATPSASTLTLNKITLTSLPASIPYAFYFTDPDESINWIYNRVFTEGDYYDKSNPTGLKSSEGISYADGLQRVRQNQKYNSSENTNIVSQIVPDYAGRPALSTIPVPVNGNLNGYKLSFVTNTLGALYTAALFDEDNTLNTPPKVQDNATSAYQYYSNTTLASPSNTHVASAEGYPYKRTLYATDGTNRVVEESGVGKAHSLGTQASGQGRTTRIMYCAPTDDELIRIFGDEAPLAESVIKTITIDQNNVMSVSYTSKEGKTIATALTSTNSPNLSSLTRTISANTSTVTNSINQNVSNGGKITSSKRIAVVSNSTNISLSYYNDAIPGPSSGCASGNCNFKMRFYLVDIKNNITYVSDADASAPQTDFSVSGGNFSFPLGWRFILASTNTNTLAATTVTTSGTGNNQISLNSGEYIFIKEIFSGNGETYAEDIVNAENDKTKPIIDAIAAQMQGVNSPATYTIFQTYMATLKTMIDSYVANGSVTTASLLTYLGIDAADLPVGYVFPIDFVLAPITTSTNNAETNNFQISTGCCGIMSVPIPKSPTCYACDGSPEPAFQPTTAITSTSMQTANAAATATAITPYGFYDFKTSSDWASLTPAQKRTAINTLVTREFITPLQDRMTEEGMNSTTDLWKIAPGFSYESLNFMISNMLISQYYTGNAIKHTNGTWYVAVSSTGGYSLTTPVSSSTLNYNYDCKTLYQSWINSLELLNSFEIDSDKNIVNEYNDNRDEPQSAQSEANDDESWNDPLVIIKKKLEKGVGKELEDYSNSSEGQVTAARQQALTSFINDFIDQVKPQFAAIIDGASLPSYVSTSEGVYPDDYFQTFTTTPSGQGLGIYANISLASVTYTDSPLLFDINNGSPLIKNFSCGANNAVNQLYYPYILKPEWMFKYYVYNVFENSVTASPAVNYIADGNLLLPHQVTTDLLRKYNDPYTYVPSSLTVTVPKSSLCNLPPTLNYTLGGTNYTTTGYFHKNWSVSEKNSFYSTIYNAPRCPESKGLNSNSTYFTNPGPLPTCTPKSQLIASAILKLDGMIDNCPFMKQEMITALTNELVSSCYTVVACKTGGAGQVTANEIELMATVAIKTTTAQLQQIKNKFTAMTATNNIACTPSLTTNTYTDGLCNLPSCTQVDCNEIILYNNNTLGVSPYRKFQIKLFADCDQKILNMIESGTFLPYVPPLAGCPKLANSKPWQQGSCTTDNTCSPDYIEKKNCANAEYEKYSKTYSVSAGSN
jgi:hypothetical protein